MPDDVLRIEGLTISLGAGPRASAMVSDLALSIGRGEVAGLVGESGCGKTLVALSLMRLLPDPPLRVTSGAVFFKGEDILRKKESEMTALRGREITMIFQEHMTALNPLLGVGAQVTEVFKVHLGLGSHHARTRTVELFQLVGIPDAAQRFHSYPHELSGGMLQRVIIAMAIALRPSLIIADEPTTALDVTIQAQVLDLLQRLQEDFHTSLLFISHDLGVMAHIATRIHVMYAGQIVEEGPTAELFATPVHPYTLSLLGSVPRLEEVALGTTRLAGIRGAPPDLRSPPPGCRFAPRCEFAFDRCREEPPPLLDYSEGRRSRCFLVAGGDAPAAGEGTP